MSEDAKQVLEAIRNDAFYPDTLSDLDSQAAELELLKSGHLYHDESGELRAR